MNSQKKIWNAEYSAHKNKWNKETSLPKFPKNSHVLELGVGNGKTLKSILRQKPSSVTAVDFSSESIKMVKNNFKKNQVKFLNADITKLPFKARTFDVIVCYYILNNLLEKSRIKAITEIHRVLKPKGLVLFEDFAVGDFRETEKTNKIIGLHTLQNKKGLICHFFTTDELKSLFSPFSKINIEQKVSTPIAHKSLKRKIISALLVN